MLVATAYWSAVFSPLPLRKKLHWGLGLVRIVKLAETARKGFFTSFLQKKAARQ